MRKSSKNVVCKKLKLLITVQRIVVRKQTTILILNRLEVKVPAWYQCKVLTQGSHMQNINVLLPILQKIRPRLKFTNYDL